MIAPRFTAAVHYQALVPAVLALVMIGAGVLVGARVRAGRYAEARRGQQRVVGIAFVVTGVVVLMVSLWKL